LSWLLLVVLGIIWAAFLFPSRRSPRSSVEEFERKMSMLADTHNASPGRWVLMPRKGHRFMGPHDRTRARARRRRRQLLSVLVEACALTFLIGLFPPLRKMLYGTAVLIGVLVVYVVALVQIKAIEGGQARARHLMARRSRTRFATSPAANGHNGNGYGTHGHGVLANGNGSRALATFATSAPNGNGNGNGNGHGPWRNHGHTAKIRIDEDAHVILKTSEELEREAIMAEAAKASGSLE
jgi:hypothetical protein